MGDFTYGHEPRLVVNQGHPDFLDVQAADSTNWLGPDLAHRAGFDHLFILCIKEPRLIWRVGDKEEGDGSHDNGGQTFH